MSELLVVAEHRRGELAPATLEAVAALAAVKRERDSLAVAIFAEDPDAYAAAVSVAGVDRVVKAKLPALAKEFQIDLYEAALSALIEARAPAAVAAPHSINACSYMPAVAVAGKHGCVTDIFGLRREGDGGGDGEGLIATRAAYNEKLHMEVDFPGKRTVLLTVRAGAFAPAGPAGDNASPAIETFDTPRTQLRSSHRRYIKPPAAGDVDISKSEFILSIGSGIGREESVEKFKELADAIGFTLTCSRSIADNGWLPRSRQVGQSGKTVGNCQVYIAMGISGSAQHLMGVKHVPNIIAVNPDAEASIFNVARYGVVADIFDIADELAGHFGASTPPRHSGPPPRHSGESRNPA